MVKQRLVASFWRERSRGRQGESGKRKKSFPKCIERREGYEKEKRHTRWSLLFSSLEAVGPTQHFGWLQILLRRVTHKPRADFINQSMSSTIEKQKVVTNW
jgi:hypothetical protein